MADKDKVVNVAVAQDITVEGSNSENSMVITFSRKYNYEGKEYGQVDLSGLEDMTATDMIAANKILEKVEASHSYLRCHLSTLVSYQQEQQRCLWNFSKDYIQGMLSK